MKQLFSSAFVLAITALSVCEADQSVWHGKIDANGNPSPIIYLDVTKSYKIKVSGEINLGKWWQAGEPLAEDACYEYNANVKPTHLKSFKNSLDISICDGPFNPEHIYISKLFKPKENGIHFWISDTDYSDNKGALTVDVIEAIDEAL